MNKQKRLKIERISNSRNETTKIICGEAVVQLTYDKKHKPLIEAFGSGCNA